jgi:phosphodiesterase/alkaline phosphatase D-like protein
MLPHYMILDDHEIFDDFFNGKSLLGRPSDPIRDFAKTAYFEYQHSHNPQTFSPDLYYSFEWAGAAFFVLDVRTERHMGAHATIISSQQMDRLKQWLVANREAVKFIATSVPFVGEPRTGDDKWNGSQFRAQRDELIGFIASERIGRVVFLTGDMHCSYHSTMTIDHADGPLVLHELMSSPLNQVGNGIHGFRTSATGRTAAGVNYRVELKEDEFYGRHSNLVHVEVGAGGLVSWSVYRTKGVQAPPEPVLAGVPFQL